MKLSRTTLKELSKKYRAVLLKCALISSGLLIFSGTAIAKQDILEKNKTYTGNYVIENGDIVSVEEFDDDNPPKIDGNLTINGGQLRSKENNGDPDDYKLIVTGNVEINSGKVDSIRFGHSDQLPLNIKVLDGNLNSVIFKAKTKMDISGGTFRGETEFMSDADLLISGGTFFGGIEFETKNVTFSGGDFSKLDVFDMTVGETATIESDKINRFSKGKEVSRFQANTLNITGSGLVLNNMQANAKTTNGHIILNENSMLGAVGTLVNEYTVNGNKVFYVDTDFAQGNVDESGAPKSTATLSGAQVTLNKDAEFGTSLFQTNVDLKNEKKTYTRTLKIISDEEINTSINTLLSEIKNSKAEEIDDFNEYLSEILDGKINTSDFTEYATLKGKYDDLEEYEHDSGKMFSLEDYVDDNWENRNSEEFIEVVSAAVRYKYNKFNKYLKNDYNTTVNITNSLITMNDNSVITNHSLTPEINVKNSTIIANGNNKVVAVNYVDGVGTLTKGKLNFKADGENKNTLIITGKLDSNIDIESSSKAEIHNIDNLSGIVNNLGSLSLTNASDAKIATITGSGNLLLGTGTTVSKNTLSNSSFEQKITANTGSMLNLKGIGSEDNNMFSDKLNISNGNTVDVLLSKGDMLNGSTSQIQGTLRVVELDLSNYSETSYTLTNTLGSYVVLGDIELKEGTVAKYNIDSTKGTITFETVSNINGLANITKNDKAASASLNVKGNITEDVSFTKGHNTIKSDGSEMKSTMDINSSGASLTIADAKISGTVNVDGGAAANLESSADLSVKGNVNVKGSKSEASFKGDKGLDFTGNLDVATEGDAVINFNVGNGYKGNITGNLLSANKNNTFKFGGNINISGVFDPATAIAEKDAYIEINNHNSDIEWTINENATVKYLKDEYLYDSTKVGKQVGKAEYAKNYIILNGGTLDLANGAVNALELGKFSLTADSFIGLDIDLSNLTYDTIKADTAEGAGDTGKVLTVSKINILNGTNDNQELDISGVYDVGSGKFSMTYGGSSQVGDYQVEFINGKFIFTYNPQSNPTEPKIIKEAQKAQAASTTAAASTVSSIQNVLNGRMFGGFKSAPSSNGNNSKQKAKGRSSGDNDQQYGLWAQGLYNYTDRETTTNAPGFTAKTKGVVAGFDAKLTDTVSAGVAYSYAKSDISGGTDVDTHTFMLYGQYKPNNFFMNVNVGYGMSKTELKDKTDYDSDIISANTMVGYEMGDITPYAEGRYMHIKSDSYKRNGEKFEGKSANVLTGVTGLRYSHEFGNVRPSVGAAATYDFVANNNKLVLKNAGATVETERTKRLGGEVKAGLEAQLTNSWSISADYTGNFKEHYQSHTGTVSATFKF